MFWVPSVTRRLWHDRADAGGDSKRVIASCFFLSLQKVLLLTEMNRKIINMKEREIVAQIGPTAEIVERIRPVYNFKAVE